MVNVDGPRPAAPWPWWSMLFLLAFGAAMAWASTRQGAASCASLTGQVSQAMDAAYQSRCATMGMLHDLAGVAAGVLACAGIVCLAVRV